MLWRDSAASVFDCELGALRLGLGGDGDFATVRSEAERVVEEITQSTIEQSGVGIDFAVTFVGNGNTSLFRDCPIISGDFSIAERAAKTLRSIWRSTASARARNNRLSRIPESLSHSAAIDSMTLRYSSKVRGRVKVTSASPRIFEIGVRSS